ncbi:ABC transporter substrate-binding protein (plasmid) [Azospirillum oryzae]|uniref:ABC transporter substrate-binding protein n=1 Tax=Azospirillum oryzae TaxID=286727 RepID=A0A6N1AQE7_9PROT|nr:ABC transporter substrate-binding protein [Azospirillum oryzae]KAA0587864.1 ABC transporter substrate-binding protein [Azospirillum oryzae]QKS53981.1 ABC transporter substrate-binding protein [Azospirillum oryzae]GLR77781.1 sugar ABC transporter substrate-binding protein [Azospirillum oryzae]
MKLKTIAAPIVAALLAATPALADTSGKRIALSNNYAGNTWRQAMLKSWETVTKVAVAQGKVREVSAFTTAENQVTEQAAQIQNLILQGYDAIVLDAASPTALNGSIKAACDAGIVVVSFDGIVTEPCAYRVQVDYKELGARQVEYLATRLPKGGNLLEIRGIAGSSIDDDLHTGIMRGVEKHPQFKIVASVYGDWTQTVAQKAVAGVLPSLPAIDAVVTQGGDGTGAAEAFRVAGRPTPIIILGNRYDELAWWKKQRETNGYTTFSGTIAPGISTLAFWVAQQVLDGKQLPKDVTVPYLTVAQEDIDTVLARTPVGGVANVEYTQADAEKILRDLADAK